MKWLALNARPELKLISTATAAEATIATDRRVGDEVAWRIVTAKRAAATQAASLTLPCVEAHQLEHVLHRDASAKGGVVNTGHDIACRGCYSGPASFCEVFPAA